MRYRPIFLIFAKIMLFLRIRKCNVIKWIFFEML